MNKTIDIPIEQLLKRAYWVHVFTRELYKHISYTPEPDKE